ncbi:MAG: hypothetical protein AAF191_19990 [Verrucomicrobiota bacterium]
MRKPESHLPSPSSGVALLEALLALTLFSLVAVSLVIAVSNLGDLVADQKRHSLVTNRVQTLLEEKLRLPQISTGEERVGPDELGVRYVTEVREPSLESDEGVALVGLFEIIVTASWRERDNTERIQADALRYGGLAGS